MKGLIYDGAPQGSSGTSAPYGAGLVVKYSLAGLLPGWIFWRWGLPYAILGHVAANAIHLLLQPMFF